MILNYSDTGADCEQETPWWLEGIWDWLSGLVSMEDGNSRMDIWPYMMDEISHWVGLSYGPETIRWLTTKYLLDKYNQKVKWTIKKQKENKSPFLQKPMTKTSMVSSSLVGCPTDSSTSVTLEMQGQFTERKTGWDPILQGPPINLLSLPQRDLPFSQSNSIQKP
jgi:hypothetical protein